MLDYTFSSYIMQTFISFMHLLVYIHRDNVYLYFFIALHTPGTQKSSNKFTNYSFDIRIEGKINYV